MSRHETIDIRQVRVGLFVTLDLPWLKHPFPTNSFKIRHEHQLEVLRRLGMATVRFDPDRSDCAPLEQAAAEVAAVSEPPEVSEQELAVIREKQERLERLQEHRESVIRCEKKLLEAAATMKQLNREIFHRPQETLRAAVDLVEQMAGAMLGQRDISIHSLNDKIGGEDVYFHSLNVSVLSMMLGKELELPDTSIKLLGLGALFHDLGKTKVPDKVLRKVGSLTVAEKRFLEQHPLYGEEMAGRLGMPHRVLDIIRHHHECSDGTGYPDRQSGDGIAELSRIVAVVNTFDNLCNPVNPDRALTPYEAISTMFARLRAKFDPVVLTTFIKYLGVYPPGTIVRLRNDLWGIVVSVNTRSPTKPQVLVYDPEVPKTEAVILNTDDDPDLIIGKTFRPTQIPSDVYDYLSPRKRVVYYLDETSPRSEGAGP